MARQETENIREDPQLSPLGDAADVAMLLDIPEQTIITWRQRGKGPPFLRIGRYVRYDMADVREWLASRRNLPRGA